MQRKRSVSTLSRGELTSGTIFFILYLVVLPFAAGPIFRLVELLLGVNLSSSLENALYYYILFAVTVIIFHGFLMRTCSLLLDNLNDAAQTLGLGLVGLYGLNELVYRLSSLLTGGRSIGTNLNDMAISAQISGAPRTTLLIVVLLAPFVEEVLFRGLVFGGLREKSRWIAYLASCLLFALLHVWQFAVVNHDAAYFFLMIQYLVPGLVLAWAFEHSGTLWTSVALHAAANALAVWMMG